jgi:hypothetical protein
MPSDVHLSRIYPNWALAVDEQELRRLADEMQRAVAPQDQEPTAISLDLTVRFSDRLSMKMNSLDDLLRDENPTRHAITGVELKAATRTAEVVCRIGLESVNSSSISVKGQDRQWVYVTISRIEDRLRRMRQYQLRGVYMGGITCLGGLVLVGILLKLIRRKYPEWFFPAGTAPNEDKAIFLLVLLFLAVVFWAIGVALFQDPVFRIGDGVKRHDRIKRIRVWVASVLVVTFGLGLLVQWIGRLLL